MADRDTIERPRIDEQVALRAVVEGTASDTGQAFFDALVENLARALGTFGAWVTRYDDSEETLKTVAFWLGEDHVRDFELTIPGSPCEDVLENRKLVHVPDRLVELYPRDPDVREVDAVSYLGVPLLDSSERLMGHLAVLDTRPMPRDERLLYLFHVFANRAVAEMQRLRLENELREREEKLVRLVDGAMDAIVELDQDLRVTLVNEAAEELFGAPASRLAGDRFPRFLVGASREKLETLVSKLEEPGGKPSFWIPGGLEARRVDDSTFPAEATISRYEVRGRPYYVLLLRNVDDRLQAERTIDALTAQTRYLREELDQEASHTGIIGESPAIRRALRDVRQVAGTTTTVLIHGETGTGKELFARAIHDDSERSEGPLIKVNCAAIPGTLIESELFGHEKGAFTGATQKRDGRFTLADGGTIFLDEIGELPLDLQAKLLRVLQEGEFEPVGSSRTTRVDVRVVAATNRDLGEAVRRGEFREDLYYRLNVFPIHLPPLRERGEDIVAIAKALVESLATGMGREAPPIGPGEVARLESYSWPGNVRELKNVLERALITAENGRLNLDRALPDAAPTPAATSAAAQPAPEPSPGRILTDEEMRELERTNTVRALEAAGWQVGGEGGAAELLGLKPSTLKSRIKSLGIEKPS